MLDFLQKNKKKDEEYWSILIEPSWISSAIWSIVDGKLKIIATSSSNRWDGDLVEAVDTSLSVCTQNLADDFEEPTKAVFGISSSWVENGNIKEDYLLKLKKICEDLSLTPSGFVILSEAIAHFIKSEEESPLSGTVIGLSPDFLEISIFNQAKLVGTTVVARSVSISDDVVEGLSRLSVNEDNLSPRIILYNQIESELDEAKADLSDTDWQKLLPDKFIHTPRIEVLEPNKKIMAVCLAGGSELGEINENVNDINKEEVENIKTVDTETSEELGFIEDEMKNNDVNSNEDLSGPVFKNKTNFSTFFKNIKLPKFNFSFNGGRSFIIGGTTLVTFMILGISFWWFLPKATVLIFVAPKKIEENALINFKSDVTGREISASVSGEKTRSTTGVKLVGEKAKGTVKIQNGTSESLKLSAGTVLLSTSGLKFTTSSSASVSGAISTTEPGIASVDIEASNIGSEYNLSKDEKFKVSNYPRADVEAISTANLTGGSSRQISAVSDDDRKSLLKSLTDELTQNAKEKLQNEIGTDEILVDSSLNISIENEDFSNKVNDEAATLKLNLTLTAKGIVVSKSTLSQIARRDLESKVPSEFILKDDEIEYNFSESKVADTFNLNITANLLPRIDSNEIAKKISGKYPIIAESYLSSITGFVRAEIKLLPFLPGKLGTLPHIYKNINVSVSSDR